MILYFVIHTNIFQVFHYRDGNFPSSLQFFGANSEQNKPYMAANVSVPLGLAPRYREDGYFWDATATVHTPKKEGKDLSLSLLTTQKYTVRQCLPHSLQRKASDMH